MVFDVRFGIPGFVVLILLLAAIPALVAVSGWLLQELRQSRARLRRWQSEAAPPSLPARSDEAYRYFISTLSHQSSNSLQAILGAISNLRYNLIPGNPDPSASDPRISLHYLSQIEQETGQLIQLTNRLRLLAQLEMDDAPIVVQPVQLRGVIADVIMRCAEDANAQGIELTYQGPARPPRVLVNREQITQALLNLVENGIKYTRPESCEIVIGLVSEADHLHLSVADDGTGIPPHLLPHIFDAAYRAPDPQIRRLAGSGLGLAIVRRIVERHGGQIQAQSRYGTGTVVTLSLPLATPETLD
ncbi:MAG: HAMP domain-containing histidine kinase [Caldilineaceae bacterium]|nr:HAMP domain-containing histidine kinase [Caldilineaceae bacterium]HRJ44727.1 HAMP domain-containing sensor histidine kinase [Caldilineaceae bacterium]